MVTPATQSHTIQFEGKSKVGFDPEREQQRLAQEENMQLAYEMYGPVIKFQNEKIIKRNLDAFFEKQGSAQGHYEVNKDDQAF